VIHVTGLESVLAGFGRIEAEIEIAEAEGLEDAGEAVKAAWQRNIEAEGLVDTGRYLDSITVERDGMHVKVGSDVPYGPILEYGDSRQAAHPVGERAVDEHGEDAIGAVSAHLERVVR
jgi:HK97 gp10 family phage protein